MIFVTRLPYVRLSDLSDGTRRPIDDLPQNIRHRMNERKIAARMPEIIQEWTWAFSGNDGRFPCIDEDILPAFVVPKVCREGLYTVPVQLYAAILARSPLVLAAMTIARGKVPHLPHKVRR